MVKRVGGAYSDKLKEQIYKKYGIRSLVIYDRSIGKVRPAVSYKFASIKELKETLNLLRRYPLKK